jgi:cell division protease FtsH
MKKKFPDIIKIILATIIFCFLLSIVYYFSDHQKTIDNQYKEEYLSSFLSKVKNKNISQIKFNPKEQIEYITHNGDRLITYLPEVLHAKIITMLFQDNVKIQYTSQVAPTRYTNKWLDFFIDMLLFIGFLFLIKMSQGNNLNNVLNNKKNISVKTNVKFTDVAGIDTYKYELEEIVDFLKDPKRFLELGIKLPKGVLLTGSPGTGKTLLAKAVAGEAGVPFFYVAGSDFVEVFVGMGASRVRTLFNQARVQSPAIIFIDEIDAIGAKRNNHYGGDEKNNTLNALLTEMDGFNNTPIVVMGATNRAEILDPALTRPGRFDRKVNVPLPDILGRKAILELVLSKIKVPYILNVLEISYRTYGYSGADLTNLINEALFRLVRKKEHTLTSREVDEALERINFGIGSKKVYDIEQIALTACHEIGHTLIAYKLKAFSPSDTIIKVTIIPHDNALGFLARAPTKEQVSINKEQIIANIKIALGGRAAEEICFGKEKITSGAVSDFEYATKYAINMVAYWGMSDNGMFFLDPQHESLISNEMKNMNYNTANQILNISYEDAINILKENMDLIFRLVYFLMKYETLYEIDITNIVNYDYHFVGGECSIQIPILDLSPFKDHIQRW